MSTTMRKEAHMTGQDLMGMVQLRAEDIGEYALVPGPRERMTAIAQKMTNAVKNFSFMEYEMFTGDFEGIKLTTINGGRFAADTSITTEILCNAKPKAIIRVGSCGALREDIKVGDLVIVTTAIKGDGVTQYYVDRDFVPTADTKLTNLLHDTAKESKHIKSEYASNKVHIGPCWTTDAILRETREHVGNATKQGAIAVDMVSSAFLTICELYKIPAAVILAVSDNVITGEMGFLNPDYYMAETAMIDVAFDVIRKLKAK